MPLSKNRRLITGTAMLVALTLVVVLLIRVAASETKSLVSEVVLTATGYELLIAGNVDFTFLPHFELVLNDVRLRNQNYSQELASTPRVTLRMPVSSIFSDEISVLEVNAQDLHMNILVNADGRSIWQQNLSEEPSQTTEDAIASRANYDSISVEKIRISNGSIDIQNASQGYRYNLNNLNIESDNNNLQGFPFELVSTFSFLDNKMTDPLPISLQSRITLDTKSGEAIVSDINLLISPMVVTGSIDISNLNDYLTYFGKLQSNNFDIIALMRTMGYLKYEAEFSGAIEPTEAFNFDLHFEGDSSELSLERFDGNLGETEIKARADIRFSDEYGPYSSRYELRASRIDFSPFLSLASEKADSDESSSSGILTAQSSPFDLPLDNIKGLNLLGSIAIESITASNFTIEDVNLFTNIEDGVLDVELQPTNLYGGSAEGLFRIDTNQLAPQVIARLSMEEINLNDFSSILSQKIPIEGRLDLEGDFEAFGNNSEDLMSTLSGATTFSVSENSLDISLIKQIFTEITSLSPTGESIQQWPDVIRFNQLGGYAQLESGLINDQGIQLRLDNLNILGSGGVDLARSSFDYDLEFSFLPPPQTQTIPINELFYDIPWPVQCNARFDSRVNQFCRPDFSRVREIFSQLSANTVRQRIEEEITEQLPQVLEEPARRILRNILN